MRTRAGNVRSHRRSQHPRLMRASDVDAAASSSVLSPVVEESALDVEAGTISPSKLSFEAKRLLFETSGTEHAAHVVSYYGGAYGIWDQ